MSITTIVVSVGASSQSVTGSVEELTATRIATRTATTKADLDAYFGGLERNMRLFARSPAVSRVASGFVDTYAELDESNPADLSEDVDDVSAFYLDEYLPELSDIRGQAVDPLEFVPRESAAALHLQAAYIAQNPFSADERKLLTDAEDGSAWTEVHKQAHPSVRATSDRLGFLDFMIVDARTQTIVYSVAKDVAFATNLASGPHSGSPLAAVVRQVLADPVAGDVQFADVAVYPAAGDRPTAFLATPLTTGGEVTAVLVGSISFDEISQIMSQVWRDDRAGDTGEMYLVGPDRRMRSDARLLIEDPESYFAALDETGAVTGVDRTRMEALDTSVVFQPVETEAVKQGLGSGTGTIRGRNYLGREVLSSFTPIAEDSVGWVLVAEQGVGEADAASSRYIRGTLTITVVIVVALTFAAVGWANGFIAPVRGMSRSLAGIRTGEHRAGVTVAGAREFRALGERLDAMVDRLRARRAAVMQALASKAAVIRTLMPDTAADRFGLGERSLVETIPQASVATIVVEGLHDAVHRADGASGREVLDGLVDGLDELAETHGLERVRFNDDVYSAVAGLSALLIDHAPRAAAFATAAQDRVDALAAEHGVQLSARAGVASGPVSAGLVGTSGLVFDLWGRPVDQAYALAQAATTSQVLLDRVARDRLPSGSDTVEVDTPTGPAWWLRRVGVEESPT